MSSRLDATLQKLVAEIEQRFDEKDLVDANDDGSTRVVSKVDVDQATYVLTRVPNESGWNLTSREREVVALVCEGLRNKEIAERLAIRPATVAAHLQRVYRKLHVTSRSRLARKALVLQ